MQAACKDKGKNKDDRDRNNEHALPPQLLPQEKEHGQDKHKSKLEEAEHFTKVASVPIADRAAKDPVGEWPKLPACVVVMGQKIGDRMQQPGPEKGAQDN